MSLRSRALSLPLLLAALAPLARAQEQELELAYERFELDNGLDVILHEDHSDPVVAVFVYYHVGSGREELGRSGFAHLFEHMMFQGSQNVGDDQHFKLVQEAGGTLNGTTDTDRTMYFEVLPSNQLELALWLEADRMGFLLPAMTQEKLDNQREVVKNERRQNYENRPYGLESETVARNLYPHGHPYSWTTIGSMDDLSAASLEDVTGFFRRWYGPNNATLAIGGDVDVARAKELVERWFGPIPRGPEVALPEPRPVALESTRRLVLEDQVELPQVSWVWPTVPMEHPDEAALDLLGSVLSANRSAILDKALTVDEELASLVRAGHDARELAGTFEITVRPQPGVSLDELERRVRGLLARVAEEGIEPERLQRLKNVLEAGVVRGLETVSARTRTLAEDNLFFGEPDHVKRELARALAVTPEDVRRVLETWVLDRPCVVVSTVPKGRLELAASGRSEAQVAAEGLLERSSKPEAGERPAFRAPAVWHATLANGVAVAGTPFDELPLARFSLSVPAGRMRESLRTLGLSSLVAAMLEEGTEELSGTELQDAFDALGATFDVSSDDDEISLSVSTLEKHLPAVVELVSDVLLRPRFAAQDFARVRKDRLTAIATRGDNIRAIAGDVWDALMYGVETVAGSPSVGTEQTVSALGVEDVRAFWSEHAKPGGARLSFVGSGGPEEVAELFAPLTAAWRGDAARPAEAGFGEGATAMLERVTVYLVDKPGAAQSEIRIGHPGLSSLDPRWWDAYLVNYPLGGSFTSRINLNLREDKGYTYGARSGFGGGLRRAPFTASAGVRTDVTAQSVREFMNELARIDEGVSEEELVFLRDAVAQSMSRQFESTRALHGFLEQIGLYGWPDDFPSARLARVDAITKAELDALATELLHPERAAILVVGDKASVLPGLEELGYGPVVELDRFGRRVDG